MFNHINLDVFRELYRDAEEQLPERMPVPRGRSVCITAYIDASHTSDEVTLSSHTGYLIFFNRAPIIWFSKKQSTVKSNTFSSEFIAAKACMEAIVALRFKIEDVWHSNRWTCIYVM